MCRMFGFGAQSLITQCAQACANFGHRVYKIRVTLLQRAAIAKGLSIMQLSALKFDNSSLHALPVETVPDNPRALEPRRQVKGACWSPIKPEAVKSPKLVAASLPCLALLDLQESQVLNLPYL